jgi:hypothetical protein
VARHEVVTRHRRVGLIGGFLSTLTEVTLLGSVLLFIIAGIIWTFIFAAFAVALHLPWWLGLFPAALFCVRWRQRARRVR